jgi:ribose/xylose/arabinose/galactoside ABC-type transport system permease subunit
MSVRHIVRLVAYAALLIAAIFTPGFFSQTSLLSLATTMSFVGCLAVGMTFITLSGNIMSFSLGATLAATTVVFISALPLGLFAALLMGFAFSLAIGGVQGWLIGYFRANPIIVSMAAMALIYGFATMITQGRGVYPEGNELDVLRGRVGFLPMPLLAFLVSIAVAQIMLGFTRFGRNVIMVGSNPRAAEAAGLVPWRTVAGAYLVAAAFTAIAAILMAARYSSGDMEQGMGMDYDAIGFVLVGGNAISGGEGSAFRTLLGAVIVTAIQGLLLLWGFSTQMQFLIVGLVVLGVIMLSAGAQKD